MAVREESEGRMYLIGVRLATALLTVLVEALVFSISREYRNLRFMMAVAIVNFTSNILLNLFIRLYGREVVLLSFPVLFGEMLVFVAEFIAYGFFHRFSWKLLGYVFLANAVSFSISFLF